MFAKSGADVFSPCHDVLGSFPSLTRLEGADVSQSKLRTVEFVEMGYPIFRPEFML